MTCPICGHRTIGVCCDILINDLEEDPVSTTARKARKRAGIPLDKPTKTRTVRYEDTKPGPTFGLVTVHELRAAALIRGAL